MAPLAARISGFDADVREIDGHDPDALRDALNRPQKRLRIIILRTIKGARVAALENRLESHYLPLTTEQYVVALDEVGRP